ncbi:MAG: histidine phosphatase family protein [Bacteroidia bacterium]|nr:histidine phosphatase family protein [Bacteroidia bacterium]
MKTLILIRHAKSDWGYDFLKDIDRPLNERGFRDAYMQSKWYKDNYPLPQSIYTSPAIRAISTALIFARTLQYDEQKIVIRHGIYEATTDNFLSNIQSLSDHIETAMFFGHNPTITNLFNLLSNDVFIDNIPTCGIMKLEFNIPSWKEVGQAKAGKTEYKFVR